MSQRTRLDIRCIQAADFAETVEAYMTDLRERNRAWGTTAPYVHALYQAASYAFRNEDHLQPPQLQLFRLLSQAEKQ